MKQFPKEDIEALKMMAKRRKKELQEKQRYDDSQKNNPFHQKQRLSTAT